MEKDPAPKFSLFKPAMTAIRYGGGRPLFFWLNAVLVGGWLFLLWPLFSPVFLSPIYAVYLALLVLPALAYAYLALIGGNRINFGLLIVSFLVFAIGETYLRLKITLPEERFSGPIVTNGQYPYYMFAGAPNYVGQMAPQMGGTNATENLVKLNSLGFRIERPLEKSKPAGELRIFVVGGSTVFMGAPLANTIAGQIESELVRRGISGAKVYNFGAVSFVSGQELALLTHLLVDYEPDVVISYGGGNDLHTPYQYDPRPGFPLDFVTLQMGTRALAGKLDLRTALASQLFKSRLITLIFARRLQEIRLPMRALRMEVGYRTPHWEKSIIEAYSDNLHRMCRIGHGLNFEFYAVLQPLIFQKSSLSNAEKALEYGDAKFVSYMRRQHERAAIAFSRLQTVDGADGLCRFVDLSNIFADDPRSLFWDFIHVNNDGNATIGSTIAADLARSSIISDLTH